MKLNSSHVALSDQAKKTLIETLNVALATSVDLGLQLKQAHWNIKGPQFFARHQLFDQLTVHAREATDEIAERAATLGGYARGTVRLASEHSKLPEYDLQAFDGRQHLQTLVQRYATYTGVMRDAVHTSQEANDPVTEDLFIEVLRTAELDMWFLESHLLT